MTTTLNIGFRILPAPAPLPEALIRRFAGLASANLGDVMNRLHYMDEGIKPRTGLPVCGPALTILARPADNLMIHKAMQHARPGDILVVNTCGNTSHAVFGELMATASVAAGIGGLVVDGGIRDVEGVQRLGFPAFSRCISPGGPHKDGPGEINVPISCGGTVVMPGDIIVGDHDGVAVVPREHAAEVLEQVTALMERERARIAEIRGGLVFKPDIDNTLRAKGIIA
ncbi:MAG TPA: RraA family protein [Gemmatimonadales bacterium]|jgi:regulator of RNase E activity RraA|nr:RraA family protein [Gemmatimonadales bacterium]